MRYAVETRRPVYRRPEGCGERLSLTKPSRPPVRLPSEHVHRRLQIANEQTLARTTSGIGRKEPRRCLALTDWMRSEPHEAHIPRRECGTNRGTIIEPRQKFHPKQKVTKFDHASLKHLVRMFRTLTVAQPFPGEFAGASLKRHPARLPVSVARGPFPGEFAGASLKFPRVL